MCIITTPIHTFQYKLCKSMQSQLLFLKSQTLFKLKFQLCDRATHFAFEGVQLLVSYSIHDYSLTNIYLSCIVKALSFMDINQFQTQALIELSPSKQPGSSTLNMGTMWSRLPCWRSWLGIRKTNTPQIFQGWSQLIKNNRFEHIEKRDTGNPRIRASPFKVVLDLEYFFSVIRLWNAF